MTRLKTPIRMTDRLTFWTSRAGWILMVFVIISGLLLAFEHRVHLLTGTVGLAVLFGVCVIMLVVIWRGHGPATEDKGDQS